MVVDPAVVSPPRGMFSERELARWPQHVGVRRILGANSKYQDQYMFVRSVHNADARRHLMMHGFEYVGRLAFNVRFDCAPGWLIAVSLLAGVWSTR
jgi:hypothetical protein